MCVSKILRKELLEMTFKNFISLMLIIALGLSYGCAKKYPKADPTTPQYVYAKWNIAVNLHHWDEARTLVVPGGEADQGIDQYIYQAKSGVNPTKDNGSVDELTSELTCEMHGNDVALVRWLTNDWPVFIIVKQNGKWLFKGYARSDLEGNPIVEP